MFTESQRSLIAALAALPMTIVIAAASLAAFNFVVV